MAAIKVHEFMTLDGVIEDPGGVWRLAKEVS